MAAEVLGRGEPLRIRVRGASMLPFVRDRDIVEIDPALRARVRPGDLACCETEPGVLHVHRVVASRTGAVLVRGDALPYARWVSTADVLGLVVAIQRGGRRRAYPGSAWRGRLALHVAPWLAPAVECAFRLRPLARHATSFARGMARRVRDRWRDRRVDA